MDWTQFFGFILTIGGLFLWNRSESNSDRRDMMTMIRSIQEEMKDFHGRMERQDAEFKCRMEKQDAEFKSGFLLLEEKIRNRG